MTLRRSYVLVFVVFALVAAACSSGTDSSTTVGDDAAATTAAEVTATTAAEEASPPTTAGEAPPTTAGAVLVDATIPAANCDAAGDLRVMTWADSYSSYINDAAAAWIADYCPGATVTVEPVPWGDYWPALQIAAGGGGDLPDILWMSPVFMPFYQSVGVTASLQSYLDDAGIDPSIWGALSAPWTFGDEIYGTPINWDTVAVAYNKDLFDQAGLDYPVEGWTWDDYATAAEAISALGDDIFGAAGYAGFQEGWGSWVASAGVAPGLSDDRTRCTLEDPGSIEALAFFKDLVDRGIAPTPNEAGGPSPSDAIALFGTGRLGMTGMGSWNVGSAIENNEFEFGIVRMPANPNTGESRSITNNIAWVINSETDLFDLAANFVQYFSSDQGSQFWVDNAAFAPANPAEALQQGWLDRFEGSGVDVQVYVDALTQNPQAINPHGDAMWAAVNDELTTRIFTNGEDLASATAALCETINAEVIG